MNCFKKDNSLKVKSIKKPARYIIPQIYAKTKVCHDVQQTDLGLKPNKVVSDSDTTNYVAESN